jgi:Icc-related predicted phosphoesterase
MPGENQEVREKIKIWHFSDSHTYHKLLEVPEDIDVVIFSGDCANPKDRYLNEIEVRTFIKWFGNLPIEHKIFVPGNHETSVAAGLVTRNDFIANGITYLENDYAYIEDIKIFGSPYTPTYSTGWAFTKHRSNMDALWKEVDDDVDIIVSHGPPKTILDKAYNKVTGVLEHSGCQALKRHILERIKPKYCLFGHLHNNEDIINAGILKLSAYPTIFSNGSVVTDGRFGKLSSNGNILEI